MITENLKVAMCSLFDGVVTSTSKKQSCESIHMMDAEYIAYSVVTIQTVCIKCFVEN